jgi:hypothetical protein
MLLVKILKRKDASSVLVAVLMALIVWQPLTQETAKPAAKLLGLNNNQYLSYSPPGGDWKSQYLFPVVWVIVQVIVLEILAWVYIFATKPMSRKRR